MSRDDAHPSNRVLIDGAVFDGPYEGELKRPEPRTPPSPRPGHARRGSGP